MPHVLRFLPVDNRRQVRFEYPSRAVKLMRLLVDTVPSTTAWMIFSKPNSNGNRCNICLYGQRKVAPLSQCAPSGRPRKQGVKEARVTAVTNSYLPSYACPDDTPYT